LHERRRLRGRRGRRGFDRLSARDAKTKTALILCSARRTANRIDARDRRGTRRETQLGCGRSRRLRRHRGRRYRRWLRRHRGCLRRRRGAQRWCSRRRRCRYRRRRRRRREHGRREAHGRRRRRDAKREALPALLAESEVARVVGAARAADHATRWDTERVLFVNAL
jgi:hypothetical protein